MTPPTSDSILEDSCSERDLLQLTHRAMLNVLDDGADEREELGRTHRAVLNMLDDFVSEKSRLEHVQKANLNILEDLVALADELQRANRELRHLDELKSEFVAMASHELRTPLTSISGFSSTMLRQWDTLSDVQKFEFVGIIDAQSQRLSRLVEGLLTISQIESGALKTSMTTINVCSAIRQTIHELDADHVEVVCDEGLAVVADRDHVQQIIVNYVANAIKHGAVPIRVVAELDDGFVRIRVTDEGEGVAAGFVSHLFERFSQADDDQSRSAADGKGKGAGLGLSIVYALVKAQGGDAWYEPNEPTGSCFNVRLPVAPPAPQRP